MTNWKQGDKCKIRDNDGSASDECTILYIDEYSIIFSSLHPSIHRYLKDVVITQIKTDAEIERERVVELAYEAAPMISTWTHCLEKLYDAGLLSDPAKRVKPIGFDEFSKAFYMETCLATYHKWIKERIIQGVDNHG